MRKEFDTIIWDLGGVLIDWNPIYVFTDDYFDTTETRDYFLEKVCTHDWNENQDAGYPIIKATEERVALFPEWESAIRDFYGRWEEMLGGPVEGSLEIFRQLKSKEELNFYALTNWSAETFPIARKRFDFLNWFDGILVSGEEKLRKPFPEFYRLMLDRFPINPDRSLFIDDNLRNVQAAEELGISSIHYKSADQLKATLIEKKLI